MTSSDAQDIVAALRAVSGVADADIEPGEDGGLGVLRVGLDDGVDEKMVAKRINRVLRDKFAMGVDAKHVEIIEDAEIRAVAAAAQQPTADVPHEQLGGRPAISHMRLVSSGLHVTATVTLTSGSRSVDGVARDGASQVGVHRAVANATLNAVAELYGDVARFELAELEVTELGADRMVYVALTYPAGGDERLTGAVTVREDVRQAVIRGTLDALNLRLETLLG